MSLADGWAPFPKQILFEVTYACNMNCKMCYLASSSLNRPHQRMSRDEVERMLDSFYPNLPTVILTGGEPCTRKDFMSLVKAVKRRGMRCVVFTNGSLLDEDTIIALVDVGLDSISISLDGSQEVFHEVTGRGDLYPRVVENIKLLVAHKRDGSPKVCIGSVMSPISIDTQDSLLDFAQACAIDEISFLYLHFVLDADVEQHIEATKMLGLHHKTHINRHMLSDDLASLSSKIRDFVSRTPKDRRFRFVPDLADREIQGWYENKDGFFFRHYCYYHWMNARLMPNGDIYPCERIVLSMGNVLKQNLATIWNSERFREYRQELNVQGVLPICNRCCKMKEYTQGMPHSNLMELEDHWQQILEGFGI